ncbi:MAG: MBL fold metallo-hydrolase [Planctomycetota bacterium]
MGHDPKLIVLGSGTALPRADRATSCYLVDPGDGQAILVDLGPGALHRAAQHGYGLDRIALVLLTHIHPDHCADLVALQFALMSPIGSPRPRPVVVLGHPDVALLNSRLRNAWPRWLAVGPDRFLVRPIGPGPVALPEGLPAGLSCGAYPVAHMPSSLGYRLTLPGGFCVAFSGDATEGAQLEDLGRDSDLFVLEAAVPDERDVPGHLSPRRAGRVAAACGTRRLLLTHFYPPVLEQPVELLAREGFEGRITLAEDGMVLPLVR